MRSQGIGTVRSSQVITTYGPGALVDLPDHSVIVAGLDTWSPKDLPQIIEPRLTDKIRRITGVSARLHPPPPDSGPLGSGGSSPPRHIGVRQFPEWFVVQSPEPTDDSDPSGAQGVSRRLVHLRALEAGRFVEEDSATTRQDAKGKPVRRKVVATRFVRACPKGHVDDLDWRQFVHSGHTPCRQPLWLDERGQSGDLGDLTVRCGCGARRVLSDAVEWQQRPLGNCTGMRPWLGKYAREECDEPSRLLIRTASNAYFSQVVRVLSIPDSDIPVREAVEKHWDTLKNVDGVEKLQILAGIIDHVAAVRESFGDETILQAIQAKQAGAIDERPVKQVEIEAFLAAPEGFGDDVPVNPDYHARRLPETKWRRTSVSEGIDAIVQLHRLREVSALVGFTRLETPVPDIDGEYETDVSRAALDDNPAWFPAVENRGEGIFVALRPGSVDEWLERPSVQDRVGSLQRGHAKWLARRGKEHPAFPGGPYVLLHTLAHLLMQALALRCGYPATSIRERIYLDAEHSRYGLLLYTASPDADGTLGGLVQQARHIEEHLSMALTAGALCSSDPICAQHAPGESLDERWLHGAACHSCSLIAETSCEMRNEYLDRALVVPTVDEAGAAFFERPA